MKDINNINIFHPTTMYAITLNQPSKYGGPHVELVKAADMRNYCTNLINRYFKNCEKFKNQIDDADVNFDDEDERLDYEDAIGLKYIQVYKHAQNELAYQKKEKDPRKIATYKEYPLKHLIELILEYSRGLFEGGDDGVVDIIYGEKMVSYKKKISAKNNT